MKYQFTEMEYIKAVRKADREREIVLHGKQISTFPTRLHKSAKAYSRKNYKIEY